MNILAVAQVEDSTNLEKQIAKQTIQPDGVNIFVDENPANTINERRTRIAENHQRLRQSVIEYKPEYVWQLEGDVDLPENALERLYGHLLRLGDIGYISGIQVGRHGLYCLGAWTNFTEDSFQSIDHTLTGVQQVEATGFYCLLAPANVWLSGVASWTDEPYGPDVTWGRSIPEPKYVDMGLHIGHVIKNGTIRPDQPSTCTAYFKLEDGKWNYRTS
jgi:hypothetical protein